MNSAPIRVLLVEDDRKIGGLTEEYLQTYGLAVRWVVDGAAALAEAARDEFDIVVLDLMLPERDG